MVSMAGAGADAKEAVGSEAALDVAAAGTAATMTDDAAAKAAAEKKAAEELAKKEQEKAMADKVKAREAKRKAQDMQFKPTKGWTCCVSSCGNINPKQALQCIKCKTRACCFIVCRTNVPSGLCNNQGPHWQGKCPACKVPYQLDAPAL
jgi:hypothetical protein